MNQLVIKNFPRVFWENLSFDELLVPTSNKNYKLWFFKAFFAKF